MKLANLVAAGLLAIFAVTGCGKKNAAPPPAAPMDIAGVKVDFPKLKEAVQGSPELDAMVNDASSTVRYGLYDKTLDSLAKLAAVPTLNDQQKQLVNTVIDQMKQVVAKAGANR